MMFDKYHNYRISFNFSVRNGNCMVFPFDVLTKSELINTSVTENGFYIDFANSKYLNVNIKKEILKEGANGLTEDTRFNRPAKSGEEYTDEGIYTITAKNEYTNEKTTKKIYVGKDNILKAHVQTGYSINDIRNMVKLGAKIDKNGKITEIPVDYIEQEDSPVFIEDISDNKDYNYTLIVIVFLVIIFVSFKLINFKKEKKLIKNKMAERKNMESKNEKESNDEEY